MPCYDNIINFNVIVLGSNSKRHSTEEHRKISLIFLIENIPEYTKNT